MKIATLCLLVESGRICLGIKKRKLGKDKYNGFGGMQEAGETIEQAALRELKEEAGVLALEYQKVAELSYHFPATPEWNQIVHIYLVTRWEGEPKESAEITAEWFPYSNIPYDRMWDNDKYWLPYVLTGKKVKGSVVHDGNTTIEKNIEFVETF